jgi:lysophospholipase L1-like esterase
MLTCLRPPIGATLGDSTVSNGWFADATNRRRVALGYDTWAGILSGQRVWFPDGHNFGVGGNTTQQVLARIDSVLRAAPRPTFCIVACGTNDVSIYRPAEEIYHNILAITDKLTAAGIIVILIPILGRDGTAAPMNETRYSIMARANHLVAQIPMLRADVCLADPGYTFNDPTAAFQVPRPGMTTDGLHPSSLGARMVGTAVATVLARLFPPRVMQTGPWDKYDATFNPTGNLLHGGTSGAGGGKFSGTVNGRTGEGLTDAGIAEGWHIDQRRSGDLSVALHLAQAADGVTWQNVHVSGATSLAACALTLDQAVDSRYLGSGDVLEATAAIEVDDGGCSVAGIALQVFAMDGPTIRSVVDNAIATRGGLAAGAWAGVFRTPRLILPEHPSVVRARLIVQMSEAGPVSASLRVAQPVVRKVEAVATD